MTTTPNKEVDLNVLRQLAGLSAAAISDRSLNETGRKASTRTPSSTSWQGQAQTIHSAVEKWEAAYATMKEVQQNLVAAYHDLANMEHG